jgi:hypothetical protein
LNFERERDRIENESLLYVELTMKIAMYSTKNFEIPFFERATENTPYRVEWIASSLTLDTAHLSQDCSVICCFVSDHLDSEICNYSPNLT